MQQMCGALNSEPATLTCMAASQASRGCTMSCRLLYLTPGTRFFPPLQRSSASLASVARVQCARPFALSASRCKLHELMICVIQHCQAALQRMPARNALLGCILHLLAAC